jgi:hypothetical protein
MLADAAAVVEWQPDKAVWTLDDVPDATPNPAVLEDLYSGNWAVDAALVSGGHLHSSTGGAG